ncbi:MAG: DUF885 family protein [Hyphomonadaceae bacterium]
MHFTRRTVLSATAAAVAIAAAGCNRPTGGAAELHGLLDQLAIDTLREAPEFATSLGVSEEQAGGRYIDRLADSSREGLRRQRAIAQRALESLGTIDQRKLDGQDAVTYDVVKTSLEDGLAAGAFEFGNGAQSPYVVTQLGGAYVNQPDFLASQHPITTRDQTEAYLTRLQQYARVLDQESQMIAEDAGNGMIPPDFCIDGAVAQLRGFAETAPAQTVLVTALARRLPEVDEIAESERAAFVSRAETIVRDDVLPAYLRQMEALTAIRQRAVHDAGIMHRPQGAEIYAAALRAYTTTTMSADEIHNMGIELVRSAQSEIDAIFRAQGMTSGTVGERIQALGRRPDQRYASTEAGRTQLLADLNAQVRAIQARMPEVMGRQARAPLEIVRVPAYIEAGSPGGYYQQPALDGSRPGAYYINLRDPANEWPRYSLPTLTYHEGVPGHHWQIAIQQESEGLPFYRSALTFFGAFIEGWGLYAEQLADEMGVYENDPFGRIGYLNSAAFRASRLVVDTGIHSKGWSREQAIQSMAEATGGGGAGTITEIERYCVIPGQACSYMVGRQAINRMRDNARQALGANFDQRGFHDTLLANGAVPLTVAERLINDWVGSVQNA